MTTRQLLNREPIQIETGSDSGMPEAWVSGKRILITGGGGSIGGPLASRILACGPAALLIVDRDPVALKNIERTLRASASSASPEICFLLADITGRDVVGGFAPDAIFHAAASKHLPLVEQDPSDGVINNLLATHDLAVQADRHSVSTFLLVSTDKAAAPTSVLGATKRAAEMICREMAGHSTTRFVTVRFGNVLGSSGSVVPLFDAQIQAGGPVTLTHRDAERFFITVDEGIQLILHAAAHAETGETMVLDAGPAVRIADLAARLIEREGLVSGEDIAVICTTLRDGEKLREVLVGPDEQLVGTGVAGVLRAELVDPFVGRVERGVGLDLGLIRAAAGRRDQGQVLSELARLVPGYRPRGQGQVLPSGPKLRGLPLASGWTK